MNTVFGFAGETSVQVDSADVKDPARGFAFADIVVGQVDGQLSLARTSVATGVVAERGGYIE